MLQPSVIVIYKGQVEGEQMSSIFEEILAVIAGAAFISGALAVFQMVFPGGKHSSRGN